MQTRHLISYLLFVLAIIFLLVFGITRQQWLTGVLVAVVFVLVGLIFYRRGK